MPPRAPEGEDVIVAVGAMSLPGARLLVEALGRSLVECDDSSEFGGVVHAQRPGSLFVVASRNDLGLLVKQASDPGAAIGFAYGDGPEEILACCKHLATAICSASSATGWVVYDGLSEAGPARVTFTPPEVVRIEGRPSPDQARALLTSSKRVFALRTHSDGFSMQLGTSIICAVAGGPTGGRGGTARGCFVSGRCGRLDEPVDDLRVRRMLLSPRDVQADVLVNLSCYGQLLSPGADWFRSLGAQWDMERIGQMISCWGPVQLAAPDLDELLALLSSGETLGRAALHLQRSLIQRGSAALVVLRGDPAYRLEKPGVHAPCMGPIDIPVLEADADAAHVAAIVPAEPGLALLRTLKEAVGCMDGVISHNAVPDDQNEEQLLDWIARQACNVGSMIMHTWFNFTKELVESSRTTCPTCGEWARRQVWCMVDDALGSRALTLCLACGPVVDHPSGLNTPQVFQQGNRLQATFSTERIESGRVVLELWPRRLSRVLDHQMSESRDAIEAVVPGLRHVPSQLAIISIFALGPSGLSVVRTTIHSAAFSMPQQGAA